MSEPIKNRYDFVILFDVEKATLTATLTQATCPASTPRRATVCDRRLPQAEDPQLCRDPERGRKGYRIYIKDGVPSTAATPRPSKLWASIPT